MGYWEGILPNEGDQVQASPNLALKWVTLKNLSMFYRGSEFIIYFIHCIIDLYKLDLLRAALYTC